MDIAAAMGFSSFGRSKKRKFNQAIAPKAQSEITGANSTQLGVRPKRQDQQNQSEEILDHQSNGDITILEDVGATPETHNAKGKGKQLTATGLGSFLARDHSLPGRPTFDQHVGENLAEFMVSYGGPSIPKAELHVLRQGVHNEQGDVAYFLPSFIEDPWEKLRNGQT